MSSQAQPLMVFPKEGLDLRDLPKGDLKTSEVLIRNPSQQTQLWHAKVSGVNWLKLSPSEGTLKPDDARAIDVSIDTNNLVIGNQRVMLTFTSEVDKSSAEVQVPVTLNIIQPIPAIDISNIPIPAPDQVQPDLAPIMVDLSLDLRPNCSQTSFLAITNQFNKPASWTASIQTSPNAKGWLSLDRMAGTLRGREKQNIGVTTNTNGLKPGEYEATLSVATEASNNSIKRATIGIALHVGLGFYGDDGPHCIIDPENRLDFNAKMLEATFNISSEEDKPKVVEFTVGNGGESWLIPHPTQATLQPGNLPTSSQQISLKVDIAALQPRPEPYKTDLIITCTYTNNPGHGPRLFVVPITVTV